MWMGIKIENLGLRTCHAECCHAYADVGDDAQSIDACQESGACGKHIVDKQYVMPLQFLGMSDAEGPFHIRAAARSTCAALLVGVAMACKVATNYGFVHHFGHPTAKKFALVIAAV